MKKLKCKICGKTNAEIKLTYNKVLGGFICLDCYRNQFPSIPIYNSLIFL